MARTTKSRSALPLDGGGGKGGKKKPEHTRYSSIQHFFNEKRQQLLESVPPSYSFNGRVVPETRGRLIQPLPQGISRNSLTDAAAKHQKLKSSRKDSKREHNPQYCLGRYQLVSMWNADLVTKEQEDESERAMEKMRVLQKRYRLREYDPEERGTQANQSADGKKRKTTKQGEADSREGASCEKQKMDNSEGGSRQGTTTFSAQEDGFNLKDKEICEAQGGADKESARKKQDVNNLEAASSDAEVKVSAEVTSSKKKKGKASLGAPDEAERGRPFRVEEIDTLGAGRHIWNTKIPARRASLKRKRNACEELQHEEKEAPLKKQKLGHMKSRRGRVSMVSSRNPSMSLAARYIASVSCAEPSSTLHGNPHKDPPQAIERPVVRSKIDDVPQVVRKLEQKLQDSKEKENLPNPEQIGEVMDHARGDGSSSA